MLKKYSYYGLSALLIFLVNCSDDNSIQGILDEIVSISVSTFEAELDENPANGAVIGTVEASTSDGSALVYEIASQSPSGAMDINNLTGELTVLDASLFDFETNPTITGAILASSGDVNATIIATITLRDVAEGGEGLVVTNFSATSSISPDNGTSLGTISASSTEGTVSFSLTQQSPDGAIAVNSSTGEVTVANGTLFTAGTTVTGTVEVTDGTDTEEASISIAVDAFNIWTGANITFTKADGADPNDDANQDRITDNVWISRNNSGGPIRNVAPNATGNNNDGPGGTEWALGTTDEIASLTFTSLRDALGDQSRGGFKEIVGKDLVLHLIEDDIYIQVAFTSWSTIRAGGFGYTRSTED